jgi:hypothetical protein
MVVSALGNAIAAQLLPLADCGDLDGSLLVFSDHFDGGIAWNKGQITLS